MPVSRPILREGLGDLNFGEILGRVLVGKMWEFGGIFGAEIWWEFGGSLG